MQVNKCGYPEGSGFLYTHSIAIISQEVVGSCMLLKFGFEKEILCFQTQKEDNLPIQQVEYVWFRASKSARLFQAIPSAAAAPVTGHLEVF